MSMSTTGTRLALDSARRLAQELMHCIDGESHVVGSIRRRRPDVGDIEILVHARAEVNIPVGCGGLMPDVYETVRGGKGKWKYWQIAHTRQGFKVDLFRFDEKNRGSIMLIRTGPADFSRYFVVALKRRGLRHEGGYIRDKSNNIVACPNEKFAFALAGTKWLEPEDRR